jgi:hypothetical protein
MEIAGVDSSRGGLNKQNAFFKYRAGDANAHAIAVMMMREGTYYALWKGIPCVRNSRDMGRNKWGTSWKLNVK